MALPKEYRIVKDKDIQATLKSPIAANSKYFRLKTRLKTEGNFRLLVVVSKKIHKKACYRNLIKRRVVSIFENLKSKNLLNLNLDLVILTNNKTVLEAKFVDIFTDLMPAYNYLISKRINRLPK
jgi:ribonuclease P protein component